MLYTGLNRQFINGQWKDGKEAAQIEVRNPYTNELLYSMAAAGTADVDAAFQSARDAAPAWAAFNPLQRRDLLLRTAASLMARKEEYITWLTKEAGSTYIKAMIEVQQAHDILVEAASFPLRMHGRTMASTIEGKECYVYRKPLGVVALISPWNFPLYLSMRTIAPALATGNTIVVKPSSSSPVTGATFIARLLEEAGLPAGVFNVVVGDSNIIGDYFTSHPLSDFVSFTGSTAVGKNIGRIAGENIKKSALELGGNNAFMVLDDADIDKAVAAAIFGKFLHQGQLCISINRILLAEKVFDEFRTKFIARAKQLVTGDPSNPATIVGPLIDQKSLRRIMAMIEQSVAMGAVVELGNEATGNVLLPTILTGITPAMPLFRNEVFGPAVGLITFATDDEAVQLANDTSYGLSGAIHTRDVYRGMQLARQINAGMMHVNDQTANDEVHCPFGGEKASGTGRFAGDFILDELTTMQWVSVQQQTRQYPF